jgi:hypothetical protein
MAYFFLFSKTKSWYSSAKLHVVTSVKIKAKLFLRVTNKALHHEGVWGSGCIDPRFLDLGHS